MWAIDEEVTSSIQQMPGGGVCLPNFLPQTQAQSFALRVPDHIYAFASTWTSAVF